MDVALHMVLLSSFFKAGRDLAGEEDVKAGLERGMSQSCWDISNVRSLLWQEEEVPTISGDGAFQIFC